MKTIIEDITVIVIAMLVLVASILLDICLAMAAVGLFDWVMGTAFFNAQVIGVVALILFAVGRLSK